MNLKAILSEDGQKAFHAVRRCVHPLIYAARRTNSLHAELVINSCVVAGNIVPEIANIDYSPVAYGVCRSLLDVAAGTVYLAQHPELTDDFQDYGKWLQYCIARSFHPPIPEEVLPDHKALEQHFRDKGGRGFPTWHGLTQERLVQIIAEDGRVIKNYTSAFLHGDALMSIAAMAYSPKNGWKPKLFHPMMTDYRLPVELAIGLYADLLVNANGLLDLGCEEVVRQLDAHMRTLGLPGYL